MKRKEEVSLSHYNRLGSNSTIISKAHETLDKIDFQHRMHVVQYNLDSISRLSESTSRIQEFTNNDRRNLSYYSPKVQTYNNLNKSSTHSKRALIDERPEDQINRNILLNRSRVLGTDIVEDQPIPNEEDKKKVQKRVYSIQETKTCSRSKDPNTVFGSRDLEYETYNDPKDANVKYQKAEKINQVIIWKNKVLYYYGELKEKDNGLVKNGLGIVLEEGYTYTGEFEEDLYSGKGIGTAENCTYFVGEWRCSKKVKGTYYDIYDSVVSSGELNENGLIDSAKPCALKTETGELYVGIINSGERNGDGTEFFADGPPDLLVETLIESTNVKVKTGPVHIQGTWKDDKKHGNFKIFDVYGKIIQEKCYNNGKEEALRKAPQMKGKIRIISSDFLEEDLGHNSNKKKEELENSVTRRVNPKNYALNDSELDRLKAGWLSANNLNFYISYIQNKYQSEASETGRIFVLGNVVSEHMQRGVGSMKILGNQTKRFTLRGDDIKKPYLLVFDVFDRILFPITLGSHWVLAEINCSNKSNYKALIYNSMSSYPHKKGHHSEYLKIILNYLVFEITDKCKDEEIKKEYLRKLPKEWSEDICPVGQQANGSDCGVFVCGFIKHIFENEPLENFNQAKAYELRKDMIRIAQEKLKE